MNITREDILQIATRGAKLSVDESELEKLTKDMSEMISFAYIYQRSFHRGL